MSGEDRVRGGWLSYLWAGLIAFIPCWSMLGLAVVYAQPPLLVPPQLNSPHSVGTANRSSILVTGGEAAKFAKLFLPEFLDYVIQHDIQLRLSLSEEDSLATGAPESQGEMEIDDSGQSITPGPGEGEAGAAEPSVDFVTERLTANKPGLPFSLEELQSSSHRKESPTTLLWGPMAREWSRPLVEYRGRILWFQGPQLRRGLRYSLQRVFLRALPEYALADQLFRELFRVNEAEELRFYSVLTFRFMPLQRDRLWWNSPAVSGVLEMPWTLRSNKLLGADISLDDFNLWSGHPGNCIDPEVTAGAMLLPLIPVGRIAVSAEHDCESLRRGIAHSPWSFDEDVLDPNPELGHKPDWLPMGISFVRREVAKVECLNGDPFKDVGTETIYFDARSLTPLARIVRDRRGLMTKLIMGVFSEVTRHDQSQNKQEPITELVSEISLALNSKEDSAAAFEVSEIRRCGTEMASQALKNLQPAAIGSMQ